MVLEFWLGVILAGPGKALRIKETSTISCPKLLRPVFTIQKKLRIINKKMVTIGEECQLIISFLSFGFRVQGQCMRDEKVSVCLDVANALRLQVDIAWSDGGV